MHYPDISTPPPEPADATRPRFSDIARDLAAHIASGRYPVGTTLPTELELRDHYGTSRHTIRAALTDLQRLGLVSRRKNAGTRVESMQPRHDFKPSLASVDDVVQFGSEHARVVRETGEIVATGALAKKLGCANGTTWLRIASLRVNAGGQSAPIGWTDVYVDPAYAEIAEAARARPDTLISALIEARYGRRIAEIQQDVHGVLITKEMARRLRVDEGAAALEIARRYIDATGAAFEVSISVHPADRFSVSMRLTRSDG